MNDEKLWKNQDYNGYTGNILGVDGKNYLLLQKEIVEGKAEVDQNVSFLAETYETAEEKENIARFVKVLTLESQKKK